jgi:hypothetical protein
MGQYLYCDPREGLTGRGKIWDSNPLLQPRNCKEQVLEARAVAVDVERQGRKARARVGCNTLRHEKSEKQYNTSTSGLGYRARA